MLCQTCFGYGGARVVRLLFPERTSQALEIVSTKFEEIDNITSSKVRLLKCMALLKDKQMEEKKIEEKNRIILIV